MIRKTFLCLAILALLSGCGMRLSKNFIDRAEALCEPNGGIDYIITNSIANPMYSIICKNGVTISDIGQSKDLK